ncbi:MAG: DUF393 domain-containing protein [Bacteroidetes bacterium]|nr:DUF393 domain-containing protein [Bacteroidota bacterium]
MKESKILIYDDNCPLCSAYTSAFVKTGLLEKEGRQNFNTIDPAILRMIDESRSKNEIPLVDIDTNQVWYGIDALLEIIDQKFHGVKTIGRFKPINWLLKKMYKLISINRRLIVATDKKKGNFDCTPDFNTRYRLIFLFLGISFNTLMLYPINQFVLSKTVVFTNTDIQLQSAHIALVLLNIFIAFTLSLKARLEYLGQINMVSLLTILLIIPLLLLNRLFNVLNPFILCFYLGGLSLFIAKEYWRRLKFAGIIPGKPWIVFINIVSLITFLIYLIF